MALLLLLVIPGELTTDSVAGNGWALGCSHLTLINRHRSARHTSKEYLKTGLFQAGKSLAIIGLHHGPWSTVSADESTNAPATALSGLCRHACSLHTCLLASTHL
jgi:hypothetical protein